MSFTGFAGAPVSKIVSITTALVTLVVLSNRGQDVAAVAASRGFDKESRWWRLFISIFPLASMWELILALHLIRMFRLLERHMGSAKFGSFLAFAAALTKGMELYLCKLFPNLRPHPGPLSVLSALAMMYYGCVPPIAPTYFTLGDLQVTEKVTTYFAISMLAFYNSWRSLAASGWGVLTAIIYCSRCSRLQSFCIPGHKVLSVFGSLLKSRYHISSRRKQLALIQTRHSGAGAPDGQPVEIGQLLPRGTASEGRAGLRQRMEIPSPSEEDIALLMGLGFDRSTVVRVFRASGNNAEAAANILLGH